MATHDPEGEAERRMRRAREAIAEFVAELELRVTPASAGQAPGSARSAASGDLRSEREREVGLAAARIEERIAKRVDAGLRADEHRLELQGEALEAAPGDESGVAREALAEIEAWREELERARGRAVEVMTAGAEQAPTQVAIEVAERTLLTMKRAEQRLEELGALFEKQTVEGIVERAEAGVAAAEHRLEAKVDSRFDDCSSRLGTRIEEDMSSLGSVLSASVEQAASERSERALESLREAHRDSVAELGKRARAALDASRESFDASVSRIEAAAIQSSVEAANEATERRLDTIVSELDTEAAQRRTGLDEELLTARAALDAAATDARARLQSEVEGSLADARGSLEARIEGGLEAAGRELRGAGARQREELSEQVTRAAGRNAEELQAQATERIDVGLDGLEARLDRRLDAGLKRIDSELSETIAHDLERELALATGRATAELGTAIDREVSTAAARTELELTTTVTSRGEAAVADAAGRAAGEIEARAAAAGADVERLRKELSKRGIRRERERLLAAAAKAGSDAHTSLSGEATRLHRELEATARRAGAEIERGLAASVGRASRDAAASAVERRLEDFATELGAAALEAEREAGRRIAAAADISGADPAERREERIRERTERARARAERRVRKAEERLAGVLAELSRSSGESR